MTLTSLTKFQRRAWIANTISFATVMAAVMHLGGAFEGEWGFPTVVYMLIVVVVSAMLKAHLRDKDGQYFTRLFGGHD